MCSAFKPVLALLAIFIANAVFTLASDVRILGGQNATLGQFPFVVSLRYKGLVQFCAGSIVDEYHVMTAAHCLTGFSRSDVIVVTGSIDRNKGGDAYEVESAGWDPKFNKTGFLEYDIAYLKLKKPIAFNENVKPIVLSDEHIPGDTDVVVIGWGNTASGKPSETLQFLLTKTISNEECLKMVRNNESYVLRTSMCVKDPAGMGACNGDSGGPLITPSDGKQVGVVSYGFICGSPLPVIYTRVSEYTKYVPMIIDKKN